jgi:hypothetical protein
MYTFWTESRAINEEFQVVYFTKSKRPQRDASESLASTSMAAAHPYGMHVPWATMFTSSDGTTSVKGPIHNWQHNHCKYDRHDIIKEATRDPFIPITYEERGTVAPPPSPSPSPSFPLSIAIDLT